MRNANSTRRDTADKKRTCAPCYFENREITPRQLDEKRVEHGSFRKEEREKERQKENERGGEKDAYILCTLVMVPLNRVK